jgi:hypothetical protein
MMVAQPVAAVRLNEQLGLGCRQPTGSAVSARLLWRLKVFDNAKLPNHKLINFETSDTGATDRELTNSYGTDGQCA